MEAPSTPRPAIILRELAPEDADELRRIHATPEVARWWDAPAEDFPLADDPEVSRLTIEVDGWHDGLLMELVAGDEPGHEER